MGPTLINSFTGKYAFLSNFYPCEVETDFGVAPSVEHAYQATKAKFRKDSKRIIEAATAGLAKHIAGRVPMTPHWDRKKLIVMWHCVSQKFTDPVLKGLLVDTGRAILIEGNTWGDTYWGVCNNEGFNHLGQLLMLTRQVLIHETEI